MPLHPSYWLALAASVTVEADGDDLLLRAYAANSLRLRQPDAAKRRLLTQLAQGGSSANALCEDALRHAPGADLAQLYYLLTLASGKAFLRYTVAHQGRPFASLEPMAAAFHFEHLAATQRYQVSRFACLRRHGRDMVLECPLGHARLVLHDARAAALLALLSQPRSVPELVDALPGLDEPAVAAFMALLHNTRAAFAVDAVGSLPEDISEPLQQWEFHDLLFHSRSRAGRHDTPLGASCRFAAQLRPLPAVKPPMSTRRIALEPPAEFPRTPFFEVLAARRSQSAPGPTPMRVGQLSALLYHAARIKTVYEPDPAQAHAYESSKRPCASGGAMHALELYLTVTRCEGLAAGFYHYDPLTHALEQVAEPGPDHHRLLQSACHATGVAQPPDVLISLAARFQRHSWKYQSIAYALLLKDLGALYQQLYLVATALQLAPCALGSGDSDLFAKLAGTDYYVETTVGEFTVSGM